MRFKKLTKNQRQVAATIHKLGGPCPATRYICNSLGGFWRPALNFKWVISYWSGKFEWYHIPDGSFGTDTLTPNHLDYYIRHYILTT